jgi:type I restriction enzyme R subunit
MSEAPRATRYEPISVGDQSTVVAEYVPDGSRETTYQSEAALEAAFIEFLQSQAYEYLRIPSESVLVANLRAQLEALNGIEFSDDEWGRFFSEKIAAANEGIIEKSTRIQ